MQLNYCYIVTLFTGGDSSFLCGEDRRSAALEELQSFNHSGKPPPRRPRSLNESCPTLVGLDNSLNTNQSHSKSRTRKSRSSRDRRLNSSYAGTSWERTGNSSYSEVRSAARRNHNSSLNDSVRDDRLLLGDSDLHSGAKVVNFNDSVRLIKERSRRGGDRQRSGGEGDDGTAGNCSLDINLDLSQVCLRADTAWSDVVFTGM